MFASQQQSLSPLLSFPTSTTTSTMSTTMNSGENDRVGKSNSSRSMNGIPMSLNSLLLEPLPLNYDNEEQQHYSNNHWTATSTPNANRTPPSDDWMHPTPIGENGLHLVVPQYPTRDLMENIHKDHITSPISFENDEFDKEIDEIFDTAQEISVSTNEQPFSSFSSSSTSSSSFDVAVVSSSSSSVSSGPPSIIQTGCDNREDDEEVEQNSNAYGPMKQCDQWNMRYTELCHFKNEYGHCSVPYNYQENPRLAQWVKRQRHQMKRKLEGFHSNLSPFREQKLSELGFIWDAHKAGWDQYFHQLVDFKERFGHCNVPTKFPENPQLAVWVKLQRRQFRLMKKSILQALKGGSDASLSSSSISASMTHDRVTSLESLGFVWNPRNLRF